MTERITDSLLEKMVKNINIDTGNPVAYMNKDRKTLKGHYKLDKAYGGIRLVRVGNESGGVHDISPRVTKREMYYILLTLREFVLVSREA